MVGVRLRALKPNLPLPPPDCSTPYLCILFSFFLLFCVRFWGKGSQNGYHEDSSGNYVVTGIDGLQNLFADTTINAASANITLESPVTLDENWKGENIAAFTGELNGNGNTITMKGDRKQGLFNEIGDGGTVENVHLQIDGTISGSGAVGGIAGTLRRGTITGCSVELNGGSITATGNAYAYAGGIVGANAGTIEHCDVTSSGSITAAASSTNTDDLSITEAYAGGIAGRNEDAIESSCSVKLNDGSIQATATGTGDDRTHAYAGGIAGYDFSKGVKCGPATGTGTIQATVTGTSSSNGSVTLTLNGDNSVTVEPEYAYGAGGNTYAVGNACAGTKTA